MVGFIKVFCCIRQNTKQRPQHGHFNVLIETAPEKGQYSHRMTFQKQFNTFPADTIQLIRCKRDISTGKCKQQHYTNGNVITVDSKVGIWIQQTLSDSSPLTKQRHERSAWLAPLIPALYTHLLYYMSHWFRSHIFICFVKINTTSLRDSIVGH